MTALEGSTTLPVVGSTKKSYVAVGVALVGGVVAWAYYKRMQGADTTGGATSYYADTRTGADTGSDAYANPAPSTPTGAGAPSDSFKAPSTDPEWAQAALNTLNWYEPSYVSQTVGKYLSRQPLTSDEQTLIREAWAQLGHPPGNQTIITASTSTGTTPAPAPAPAGPAQPAAASIQIVGIKATTGTTDVRLDWGAVGRPDSYRVFVNGALKVQPVISAAHVTGLKRATTYTIGIAPVRDRTQGPTVTTRITTKK